MSLRITNDNSPPPDPHSKVQFGQVGPGTAAWRMHRLWNIMHEYEDLMIRYVDYVSVSSKGVFEDKFMELFVFLLSHCEDKGVVERSTVLEAIREQQAAWKDQ